MKSGSTTKPGRGNSRPAPSFSLALRRCWLALSI